MSNDINLVSGNNAAIEKEKKRLKTVRYVAVGALVLVALISILIFILNSQIGLASIKRDEGSTLQNISFLRQKAAKLAMVNNRVKDISEVLQKRKNYSETIKTIREQMPQDVYTVSLELDKKELLIIVNSSSLLSINKFLDNIISLSANKKIVRNVLIESLTVNNKTGYYSLTLKANVL